MPSVDLLLSTFSFSLILTSESADVRQPVSLSSDFGCPEKDECEFFSDLDVFWTATEHLKATVYS